MKKTLFLSITSLFTSLGFAQSPYINGAYIHTVSLAGGRVYVNGSNISHQLGNTSNAAFSATPLELEFPEPIIQTDAGTGLHSIALGQSGAVYTWGCNSCGQIGNNSSGTCTDPSAGLACSEYSDTPQKVLAGETGTSNTNLTNVKSVKAGNLQSYALLNTGEVVAWGYNQRGELGNGTTVSTSAPVYVRTSAAVKLTGIVMIEPGDYTTYALKNDGTVWAWGRNEDVCLGNGNLSTTTYSVYAVQVTKSENNTLVPLNHISQLAAGDKHALALDSAGYVWSWGGDWGPGQLGQTERYDFAPNAARVAVTSLPEFLKDVVQIAAGQAHSLALLKNGHVMSWGSNVFYQSSPQPVPAGQLGQGSVPVNGSELPKYVLTGPGAILSDVVQISAGDAQSFFLTKDKIYASGYNAYGQLGNANTTSLNYATDISPSYPWLTITGANQTQIISETKVYPSPVIADQPITILSMNASEISVCDINGKTISEIKNPDSLASLKAPHDKGIYLIKIKQGEIIRTEKLVVE
jgi:alpha-tubulin suppressor-like RCC1 family protein